MTSHDHVLLSGVGSLDLTANCTLEAYAAAKNLPLEYLQSLGLETVENPYDRHRAAVSIPYRSVGGAHFRRRIRAGLVKAAHSSDRRMLWDTEHKGQGIILYGLDRLPPPGERLVLVEGESDAQTLWLHEIDAIGNPGVLKLSARAG